MVGPVPLGQLQPGSNVGAKWGMHKLGIMKIHEP